MDLQEIAAVSGKPGLFKIIKPTRNGVILESIDAQKNKLVINSNSKVSILKDISVYTTGEETNLPLSEILFKIKEVYGGKFTVSSKSSDNELRDFFGKVVPDYDMERVYMSDIKKIATWYVILDSNFPEVLIKQEPVAEEVKEEPKETKKSKSKSIDPAEIVETSEVKPKATKIPKPKEEKAEATEKVAKTTKKVAKT